MYHSIGFDSESVKLERQRVVFVFDGTSYVPITLEDLEMFLIEQEYDNVTGNSSS